MNKLNAQNHPDFGHPTQALIGQMVDAVTRRVSVPLTLIDFQPDVRSRGFLDDGQLNLNLNGTVQAYTLVAKGRIRSRAEVEALARAQSAGSVPTLLATAHLTQALADECIQRDLQFIDLAGNLFMHAPGQHFLITGRPVDRELKRATARAGKPVFSASASALKMIFVLLCAPGLLNRPYRDIAAAAGVALGTVGGVLDDLRERGLLAGANRRRLLDPAALREEWAINYALRLLPKLRVQRFSAEDPSWWKRARFPADQAWWSGEVAAVQLTAQLRPVAQTLYVSPDARHDVTLMLVKRHRLRADPTGSVELIDAFWNLEETATDRPTAPPLLVYADLQRTREPRNLEAAALIRSQMEQTDESRTP
jgi:hypothetical protein